MSEWLKHVKATMSENKGMKLKDVLKIAKKTYKRSASASPSSPVSRKRRSRRGRRSKRGTRRH